MKRIAFIDRDGTLIEEPADFQIDALSKIRFVPDMLDGLKQLQQAGFSLVMVSNQDGLGTSAFPQEDFDPPHALLMQLLTSQGIVFDDILIDPSMPEERSPNRKPQVGMVLPYLRDDSIRMSDCIVVGDRESDMQLAENMGAVGYRLGTEHMTWPDIVAAVTQAPRTVNVHRQTKETQIDVCVNLDVHTPIMVQTGIGFFDHMLESLSKHGGFSLQLNCSGDLHVDEHHTVEDCALALGAALKQAVGDKRGLTRFGQADVVDENRQAIDVRLPMDEALASVSLDWSGRPCFVFDGAFPRTEVGGLPTEMVPHFFQSLCDTAGLNMHLSVRGQNTHHMVEACFKATARALRMAMTREGQTMPSTKGVL